MEEDAFAKYGMSAFFVRANGCGQRQVASPKQILKMMRCESRRLYLKRVKLFLLKCPQRDTARARRPAARRRHRNACSPDLLVAARHADPVESASGSRHRRRRAVDPASHGVQRLERDPGGRTART